MYFIYPTALILFGISWALTFLVATTDENCNGSSDLKGMVMYLSLGAFYSAVLWPPVVKRKINLKRLEFPLFFWVLYVILAIAMLFLKQWWPFSRESLCLSNHHYLGQIAISSMVGMAIIHSLVVFEMWIRKNETKSQIRPNNLRPFLEERLL